MGMLDQIKETCDYLRQKGVRPDVGVILGTGLGESFIKEIRDPVIIPYRDIPNFPLPTMTYHVGNLIFGYVRGKGVVAMQGRFHYYEGYSMQQITFPVRVMKFLGVSHLLISNACGNMNPKWKKGELMMLDDHINLQPDNPLRGIDQREWENPFPDMSEPYAQALNERLAKIGMDQNITLHRGVYVSVGGPNLETRAEYRFLRAIGADVVGMSTVPEVIVANHMRLPCCAVSVLTDNCDPDNLKPVSIQEIIEVAARAEPHLTTLFTELIASF
jgi:purine-nucleoside phosphorylase